MWDLAGIRSVHLVSGQDTDRMRLSYPPIRRNIVLTTLLMSSGASAQPYSGTIFIDPDIINGADPGSLVSVTYTGQGMKTVWDYRVPGWVDINAYLFDVVWNDGLTSLGVVNPEFGTPAAGEAEVQTYAAALGKVPTCLRTGVNELWIHAGVASFGGGNNAIVIHTGRGQEYIADGILEEAFVHEGTHCSLDAIHAGASGWLAAQSADPDFISTYAAGAPTTEDVAESYLPWLAVRHRASRISVANYNTILATIPNRLAYLDGITCDLYPITSGVGMADAGTTDMSISIHPSPASDRVSVASDRPLPANAIFELRATDGRLARSIPMAERAQVDLSGVMPGIYLWRCHATGSRLASGTIVIE